MKFVKMLAVVMAVLMLGSVMIACDSGEKPAETTAETTAANITVNLIIKNLNNKTVYEGSVVSAKTTLGDIIDLFCVGEELECVFDESTGLLTKLGELAPATGEVFIAYDETEGKTKAYDSIKSQTVTDGQTIVVALTKN